MIATQLAGKGCHVVLAARRADRIAAMAAEIGPTALAWLIDLRDSAAIDVAAGVDGVTGSLTQLA